MPAGAEGSMRYRCMVPCMSTCSMVRLSRSLPSAGRYYCRPMWHSCACAHDPVYPKFCLNPLNLWVSGPHKKIAVCAFPLFRLILILNYWLLNNSVVNCRCFLRPSLSTSKQTRSYHVDESNVEKESGNESKDPRRCCTDVTDSHTDDHSHYTHHRRHRVVDQSVLHRHSSV